MTTRVRLAAHRRDPAHRHRGRHRPSGLTPQIPPRTRSETDVTDDRIPANFPATANDLATHAAGSLAQHMELGCRLTFRGRLDLQVLSRAVRLSLDAEPVLGCGLRTRTFAGWWERLDDLDVRVPFSVVKTADPDRDSVLFQVGEVEAAGPQVAVRLLRSSDHDDVCMRISHDVADGQGLKQYAYLLADIYTHLLADPSYVPAPNLTPRPQARDVWDQLSGEQRRQASRAPSMTMPNWVLPSKALSGRGRTLRELRLGPARSAALKEYGRLRGATVNEMALTAFFRALARAFPPPAEQAMSLPFSAEHRRYLPTAEGIPITNLALTIWLGVEHVPGEDFDGTLRRVQEQTSAWREALWGAKAVAQTAGLSRIGYKPMMAMMAVIGRMSAKSGKTSPVFTNIGIMDESKLAFGGSAPVSASLSGPAAFGASFVPTISTYRDTLTVSMGFCAEDLDAESVEQVLRFMEEELDRT
jgi:NRPS condensation-like uncharacterized protein